MAYLVCLAKDMPIRIGRGRQENRSRRSPMLQLQRLR